MNLLSLEEFEASIEAYTYPDEFGVCDGSAAIADGVHAGQQPRVSFCLSYRTELGNDHDPEAGYKLHIIYGALAAPSERGYESINDSPEAMTFSWDLTTTPVTVTGHKATAHIELNSVEVEASKPGAMAAVEALLYGDDTEEPTVQMPDQIVAAIEAVTAT